MSILVGGAVVERAALGFGGILTNTGNVPLEGAVAVLQVEDATSGNPVGPEAVTRSLLGPVPPGMQASISLRAYANANDTPGDFRGRLSIVKDSQLLGQMVSAILGKIEVLPTAPIITILSPMPGQIFRRLEMVTHRATAVSTRGEIIDGQVSWFWVAAEGYTLEDYRDGAIMGLNPWTSNWNIGGWITMEARARDPWTGLEARKRVTYTVT